MNKNNFKNRVKRYLQSIGCFVMSTTRNSLLIDLIAIRRERIYLIKCKQIHNLTEKEFNKFVDMDSKFWHTSTIFFVFNTNHKLDFRKLTWHDGYPELWERTILTEEYLDEISRGIL